MRWRVDGVSEWDVEPKLRRFAFITFVDVDAARSYFERWNGELYIDGIRVPLDYSTPQPPPPPDWMCPFVRGRAPPRALRLTPPAQCDSSNFGRRRECFHCSAERHPEAALLPVAGDPNTLCTVILRNLSATTPDVIVRACEGEPAAADAPRRSSMRCRRWRLCRASCSAAMLTRARAAAWRS
jgi:hypothetical protein